MCVVDPDPNGPHSYRCLVSWIRIRIGNMPHGPHSYGCLGSVSVLGICIRIQEHGNWPKFTNKPLVSCLSKRLSYLRRYVCWPTTVPIFSIFFIKNLTFLTLKSDQDPDPHGSALVWLPDPDTRRDKLYSDSHWNRCGSTTLLTYIAQFFTG